MQPMVGDFSYFSPTAALLGAPGGPEGRLSDLDWPAVPSVLVAIILWGQY